MVREWLIGGSRYGPYGQNLGPASSAWFSQQAEANGKSFANEDESVLSLVVEGSLATANRLGLPVRPGLTHQTFSELPEPRSSSSK